MTGLIFDYLGMVGPLLGAPAGTVLDLGSAWYEVLDLSVQSDTMDAGGLARTQAGGLAGWGRAGWRSGGRGQPVRRGAADRVPVLADVSPATVATGIDLWLSRPAELTAPWR